MKLIGRKGSYYYYEHKGVLPLLSALPRYEPDHIIAGGAALATFWELSNGVSLKIKDIDIWVSGTVPPEADKESQWAYNYKRANHPNVQYMKILGKKPSEVLDSFDMDCCKVAIYAVEINKFLICVHEWLKPLANCEHPQGICGINQKSFNELSLIRIHKYATRFGKTPLEMFRSEDYALALKLSDFQDKSLEEIEEAVSDFEGDQYELLDHLRGLFDVRQPVRRLDRNIFNRDWGTLGVEPIRQAPTFTVDWDRLYTQASTFTVDWGRVYTQAFTAQGTR